MHGDKISEARSIQDEVPAWLAGLAPGRGPRFLQIADAIEQALLEGTPRPGERLPPQRRLAAQLNVDLTTVTRAYDEARRRRLLEGRGARGTYAAAPKVESMPMMDLSMNIPPSPEDVDFGELLRQGLAQVLMRADNELLMTYHLSGGSEPDRRAGAAWLAPMFGVVDPAQVVVCPGAQAALVALMLSLSEPGAAIVTGPAVYPGLRAAAQQFGRRLLVVEADGDGMLPEALERACREHGARLAYLNRTLQNPSTRTMPMARRREIVAAAVRHGVRIIEDDPYWLLARDAPLPLARIAPGHVYYVSTLSKCLTPGLRIAFGLFPDPAPRERFLVALRAFALMAAPLTAALATQWIHDGSAQRLLDGVRLEARARQELARDILAGRPGAVEDGLHLWLELPAYWTSEELARVAGREGLAVAPAAVFCPGPMAPNAIRVSLGSIKERARLRAALRRLSALLARQPAPYRDALV
ncbi:aminotransferase-like domain-containing protein [Massilia niastensis]|uniref:aminotransferase-like domain-containing protein n=1 Tax=Massilia niastensis TaxID=544911 RepID=UPI0003743A7D|nr:PLP-dependent aminotransferase family protein [Massilia niastensis]